MTRRSTAARAVRTPIGTLGLIGSDAGLAAVHWTAEGLDESTRCAVLDTAAEQLEAYFARELVRFEIPLDLDGTAFQVQCWNALASIPYGRTVSYGEQARRLGLPPGAARAVGAANGRNPVPIVLPCHRVVGANGSLTGFGGGLALKQFLLEHEGALLALPETGGTGQHQAIQGGVPRGASSPGTDATASPYPQTTMLESASD